jgi:hypothetical protein
MAKIKLVLMLSSSFEEWQAIFNNTFFFFSFKYIYGYISTIIIMFKFESCIYNFLNSCPAEVVLVPDGLKKKLFFEEKVNLNYVIYQAEIGDGIKSVKK